MKWYHIVLSSFLKTAPEWKKSHLRGVKAYFWQRPERRSLRASTEVLKCQIWSSLGGKYLDWKVITSILISTLHITLLLVPHLLSVVVSTLPDKVIHCNCGFMLLQFPHREFYEASQTEEILIRSREWTCTVDIQMLWHVTCTEQVQNQKCM